MATALVALSGIPPTDRLPDTVRSVRLFLDGDTCPSVAEVANVYTSTLPIFGILALADVATSADPPCPPRWTRLVVDRPGRSASTPTSLDMLMRHVASAGRLVATGPEAVVLVTGRPDALLYLLIFYHTRVRRAEPACQALWLSADRGRVLLPVFSIYTRLVACLRQEARHVAMPVPTLCLLGAWAGADRVLVQSLWHALLLSSGSYMMEGSYTLPGPPSYADRKLLHPAAGILDIASTSPAPLLSMDSAGRIRACPEPCLSVLRLAYQLAVQACPDDVALPTFSLLTRVTAAGLAMPGPMSTWTDHVHALDAGLLGPASVGWR
jgi:hypothetical protein